MNQFAPICRGQAKDQETDFDRLSALAKAVSAACDRGSERDLRDALGKMKIILDRREVYRDAGVRQT